METSSNTTPPTESNSCQPKGAGVTVSFCPASGVISADELELLAKVVRQYQIPVALLTASKRGIALMGVRVENAAKVRAALGLHDDQPAQHATLNIQACPGAPACRNGLQNTLGMADRLEARLQGLQPPAKIRVGISGCPRCCGESYVRDIGLVARKDGWSVIFGGNAGGRPRIGDELASGLSGEDALALVDAALAHYVANAKKSQRTARFAEAFGIGAMRTALGLPANQE